MRRSERHHLKENAFAVAMANLSHQLQDWGRGLVLGLAIGVGILVLYGAYTWWSGQTTSQAGALLADALLVADAPVIPPPPPTPPAPVLEDGAEEGDETTTPAPPPAADFVQPPGTYPSAEARIAEALPRLLEAADSYPNTQPGITARYRAAAALASVGRHDEAAAQYRQVIDQDSGLYARMATLGLADVELARGAFDEAIALLEQATGPDDDGELPVDGVLMRLARAYEEAGRAGDARATYERVLNEFPTSLYLTNAERQLEALATDG